MKIRNGFVSNSSSSSFIVIGKEELHIPKTHSAFGDIKLLGIPTTFGGTTEWGTGTYNSNIDRLNWAALMCYLTESPGCEKGTTEWTDMLCEVLEEDLGAEDIKITYRFEDDEFTHNAFSLFGIDTRRSFELNHGCHPNNEPESGKMFKDKETLRKFLWADDSEIKIEHD